MKNIQLILSQLFIVILFASCTAYNGLTYNVNSNQTQVHLSTDNYKVVKYVEGKSTAKYLFGIGGGNKQGMVARAREEMLRNANLKGKSRAVINETVEIKARQIFIYTEFTYIVSAHIVEFYSNPANEPKVEEDVFISREVITEPSVKQQKVSAGVMTMLMMGNGYSNNSADFFAGYGIEFSKPNTSENLFWEIQANLLYAKNSYMSYNEDFDQSTFGLEIPVLLGYRANLSQKTAWFAKAGLGLGYYIDKIDGTYYPNGYYGSGFPSVIDRIGFSLYPLIELQTGFNVWKNWDVFVGYKHAFYYGDYDIAKVGISYRFNQK
jgi:hypothetical protein